MLRCFVGIGNTGKFLDFSGKGFPVEPLRIPLDQHFEVGPEKYFQERNAFLLRGVADLVSNLGIGGDGCTDGDDAFLREDGGNVPQATNVRVSIRLGESQVLGQVPANLVPIQDVNDSSNLESLRQFLSQRALSNGGQSGKPDNESAARARMTGCRSRLLSALVVDPQHLRHLVAGKLRRQLPTRAERLADLGAGKLDPLVGWMRTAPSRRKIVT